MNPEEKNLTPGTGIPKEDERTPFKALRTYQGDIDEILSKGKASASTILVAEQKRREEQPEKVIAGPKDNKARNKFFIILGSTLLFVGIVVVPLVYYIKTRQDTITEQKTKALIAFSVERALPISSLNREQLTERILAEKESFSLHPNSVLYINLVDGFKNPAPISQISLLLGPKIPPALARAFTDKYMIGIYSYDTNEPFIILTTEDYAESYAGMLRWERDMPKDLEKIFSLTLNTATTTGSFVDEAYKNKDLRIWKNSNNKTVLLYSFIDKKTLVITTNEEILSGIMGKYLINLETR